MKVGCNGCQLAEKDASNRITWTNGVDNALVLNISVGAQPETLELNGVRFYPPVMSLSMENPVPYIPQVPAGMSLVEIRNKAEELKANALRLTSWAFQAGHSQTVSESGEELLTIHLQLSALERQPITVPDITITTLKNTDGELAILKIETQKHSRPQDGCTSVLCKWRAIFAGKLSGLKGMGMRKGCGGKGKSPHNEGAMDAHNGPAGHHGGPPSRGGNGPEKEHRPHGHGGEDGPEKEHRPHGHGEGAPWKHHGPPGEGHHHGPPGKHERPHHGWHHGHRHHHGLHKALHVIGRVLLTVFVPILLGVAAGMVTYLLGMFVGAIVAAVYMKVRGRRARYQAVALCEDDEMTPRSSMEKDGFKDEEEGLVEAPPLYVEKE